MISKEIVYEFNLILKQYDTLFAQAIELRKKCDGGYQNSNENLEYALNRIEESIKNSLLRLAKQGKFLGDVK